MEKYIKDNLIVVCKVLSLAKDKGGERIPPYDYSNREKESILKLSRVIELDYLNIKPHDYSDTKDYWEEVEGQIKFREKISKQADGPGNWPLPYFFVNPKGIFHYDDCENYRVAFGDTEEFNISFGLLIRNLIFAEAKKVFHLYYDLHSTAFIEFLEIHLLEYSFLFENSNLIALTEKWIKSKDQAKTISLAPTEASDPLPNAEALFIPEINIDKSIRDGLFEILKNQFIESQLEAFRAALDGVAPAQKLIFMSRANHLALVFTQLQDGGKILSDAQNTKHWLCKNFRFIESGNAKDFKMNTVQSVFNRSLKVSKKKIIDISSLLKS